MSNVHFQFTYNPFLLWQDYDTCEKTDTNKDGSITDNRWTSFSYLLANHIKDYSSNAASLGLFPTQILDSILLIGRSAIAPFAIAINSIIKGYQELNQKIESGEADAPKWKFILQAGGIVALIALYTPINICIQTIIQLGHILRSIVVTIVGLSNPQSALFTKLADIEITQNANPVQKPKVVDVKVDPKEAWFDHLIVGFEGSGQGLLYVIANKDQLIANLKKRSTFITHDGENTTGTAYLDYLKTHKELIPELVDHIINALSKAVNHKIENHDFTFLRNVMATTILANLEAIYKECDATFANLELVQNQIVLIYASISN